MIRSAVASIEVGQGSLPCQSFEVDDEADEGERVTTVLCIVL